MSEHAILSFSASPRWLRCTGSLYFEQTLPDGPSSEAADRGTRIHEAAAKCLMTGKLNLENEEDAEWALVYVNYINNLAASLGGDVTVLVEQKVVFSEYAWGTADCIILSPGRLDIIDLKTGRHPVPATSPQLALYALAALAEFNQPGSAIRHSEMPREVHCHIVQPSLSATDETVMKDDHMFRMLKAEVGRVSQSYVEGDFEFAPSEEACQWCRGRNECKARADYMHAIIVKDFDDAPPPVTSLTIADFQRLLPHLDAIVKYCEDIKAHCTTLMTSGAPIPGFKLVATAEQRRWADPAATVPALVAAGIPVEAATKPPEPITIGAAEKILGKKNPVFATLTKKVGGNPTIVPESDRRPALQVSFND